MVQSDAAAGLYEQALLDSRWFAQAPLEYTWQGIPRDRVVRGLVRQYQLLLDRPQPIVPFLHIIVLDGMRERVQDTVESLMLQCSPSFVVTLVPSSPARSIELKAVVAAYVQKSAHAQACSSARIRWATSLEEAFTGGTSATYVCCLRAGDYLDPSLVARLELEAGCGEASPDVYVWNDVAVGRPADGQALTVTRRPRLELYTLLHHNYVSYCFAVRMTRITDPGRIASWWRDHEAHAFLISLGLTDGCRWVTIPHVLSVRVADSSHAEGAAKEPVQAADQQLVGQDFQLDGLEGSAASSVLPPRKHPNWISVIVPFRDRALLTIAAIRSVLEQDLRAGLEVVLVDNQSRADELDMLTTYTRSVTTARVTFRLVHYDKAFNHSAQCNLGVQSSRGDVLVLLNNDARALSAGALSAMASWALHDGIGTVGIRVQTEAGGLESAGIALRAHVRHEWDSPVEGSQDPTYARLVRHTWGNGFACAALSRATYARVGPLDETRFPNGYNDVEYSARCRRMNLINMYLGNHCVVHTPGTSRGRIDETYQKIALRRAYPELAAESLFQLQAYSIAVPPGAEASVRAWPGHIRRLWEMFRQRAAPR